MDSIRPLQNYDGNIVPQAVLNGTLGTVVYASNYNDLDNKPSINSIELRGNKTAGDLGLATPADITVNSVNTQTGDVSLTGQNIPYDSMYSVTEKINDLESQIVDTGVSSVNGHTGAVILTGSDINYSVGVSLNAKIDAVEGEIPVVNYPVTSVNSKTGAVVLAGSDIEYSAGVSITDKIDAVESEIPVVDYPVTSVNGETGDVSLSAGDIPLGSDFSDPTSTAGAIGDMSTLTTTDKSSLVGAVNEVNKKESETLTYTSGANTASFTFNRFGNMVCVIGSGGAMPLPTSWTNLTGTLSANFRPTTALSLALITGDNHLIFLEINTNGTVRVYSNYAGNLYPSGTGIYISSYT